MLVAQYYNARVLAPIDYPAIVVADEAALTSQLAGGVRWHPLSGKLYWIPTDVSNWACFATNAIWHDAGLDPDKDSAARTGQPGHHRLHRGVGQFPVPLVIVQDKDLNVLSVGMTNYSQPYQREPMWAAAIAASTVATLPIAAALRVLPTKLCKGSDCCGGEG
jgi:hypothetical protein